MAGHSGRTPFVGRQREITRLLELLQTVGQGEGGLLLVAGEPGIGKSRLVQEYAHRARSMGWLMLTGRAYDSEGMPPYLPFTEALRDYVRSCPIERLRAQLGDGAAEVALLLPGVRHRLPDLLPSPPLAPEHERYRLFESVSDFVLAIARDVAELGGSHPDAAHGSLLAPPSGLLLVLDDLHWADTPTLRLLLHLARRLTTAPLLVVAAHRSVDLGPAHPLTTVLAELHRERLGERLALAPFSAEEAATLISGLTSAAVTPDLVQAIAGQTEGLPFFIEEVVRQLQHDGLDLANTRHAETTAWRIPEGIQQVLGQRLARLSPAVHQLLQAGAVLGDGFRFEVAAAMCQEDAAGAGVGAGASRLDPLLDALDEALTAGVVREEGAGYHFHHALIRRCLTDALTLPRQRQLHLRAAQALEHLHSGDIDRHVTELASHYHRAGPAADREITIRYTLQAAEAAATAFAWEEAAAWWQAALVLLAPDDDAHRCEVLLALGNAQRNAGDLQDARQTLQRAADLARRTAAPERLAQAALGFVRTLAALLGPLQAAAVALLREALDQLAEGDSTPRAQVLGQLAAVQRLTSPWEEREVLSRRAVTMARRLGDRPTLGAVLVTRHRAIDHARTLDERRAIIAEVLPLAEQTGDPALAFSAYYFQILAALEVGDAVAYKQAIDHYHALAQQLRTAIALERALQMQAMRAMMIGRLAETEDLLTQAWTLTKRIHAPGSFTDATNLLAYLRIAQGRAGDLGGDPSAAWVAAAPAPLQLSLRSGRALVFARAGRIEAARAEFEQVAAHDFADLHRYYDEVLTLAHLAEVCALLGDARRAPLLYQRLLPLRTRAVVAGGGPMFYGAVAHYLGLLAALCLRAGRPEAGAVGAGSAPAGGIDASDGVNWATAVEHFEAALAFHARMGARMWVAHTGREYAAMLLQRGRPADQQQARELLEQAVAAYTDLGIDHAAAAARQLLPPSSRAAVPAAVPTFPDGLSAREVEVLRLLAAGKSNRDIAEALVVSPHTAARHVSNIFSKSGVSNRAEAAAYAIRHGLVE